MFKAVVSETGSFEIAQWKAVTRLIADVQRESLFPTELFNNVLPSIGCFKLFPMKRVAIFRGGKLLRKHGTYVDS